MDPKQAKILGLKRQVKYLKKQVLASHREIDRLLGRKAAKPPVKGTAAAAQRWAAALGLGPAPVPPPAPEAIRAWANIALDRAEQERVNRVFREQMNLPVQHR